MRIAYFTPLPSSKSGIADYNSELLPYQMRQFDVLTRRLIHGLMRFDAEWRSDIISEPKRESVTLR
jgi:hypothetical protein